MRALMSSSLLQNFIQNDSFHLLFSCGAARELRLLLPSAGAESTTEPKQTCNMRLWKNILEQRQDIFQLKIRKFCSFFRSELKLFFHQASTKLVNFAKIEFCTEKWTNFHEFFHLLSFEVFSGTYWGTLYVFTSAKKKKKWFAAIVTFWQIYF